LGILVWGFIDANLEGSLMPFSRSYRVPFQLPITVLATSTSDTFFEITPSVVNVEIVGRRDVVNSLTEEDLRAFADLSDLGSMPPTAIQRPVQVYLPPMDVRVLVEPLTVQIQFLQRPDPLPSGITN